MKKERKEVLLRMFPDVPQEYFIQMKDGKGANNYAVMLTRGAELFVRCFHRYSGGKLEERQRYVFAKDGCFRAGSDDGKHWTIRKDFREPVFCKSCYGYNFDNSYSILNENAWKDSDMRYSEFFRYTGDAPLDYLRLYCRHPNVEYLMKSGYACTVIDDRHYYWYGQNMTRVILDHHINWRSNDLLKMLNLNRTEFKILRGHESLYDSFMNWRELMPKTKPEELLLISQVFRMENGTADEFAAATGLRIARLARYLCVHSINLYDYRDYLVQCRTLQYDLHDTAISMPRHFEAAHTRLSEIIEYKQNETKHRAFAEHIAERERLEFSMGAYHIIQPRSMNDIVSEGKMLHHCVGGYAARHAEGKLHILFIRKNDDLDEPYFTMEVSTEGKVIQVRGLRNCDPPEEVKQLVKSYQNYIAPLFAKRQKVRVSA